MFKNNGGKHYDMLISLMLHTGFQGRRPFGCAEDFLKIFYHKWVWGQPGHVTQIQRTNICPHTNGFSTCDLALIGHAALEEMFENYG